MARPRAQPPQPGQKRAVAAVAGGRAGGLDGICTHAELEEIGRRAVQLGLPLLGVHRDGLCEAAPEHEVATAERGRKIRPRTASGGLCSRTMRRILI